MANANRDLAASMPESWEVFEKYKAALAGVNEESEKFIQRAELIQQAFDKIREAARSALEEQQKFNEMLKQAAAPDDEYAEKLDRSKQVLDAHIQQQTALLKVQEEGELAQAATPEERAKIRARYKNAREDIEDGGAEKRLALVRDTIGQIDNDIATNEVKREALKDEMVQKAKSSHETKQPLDAAGVDKLNQQIAGLNATIADLTRKRSRYNSRLLTDSDTTYIGMETHKLERAERALGPGDDTVAGGVAASFAARAGRISEQQRQAFADLAELYNAVFGNTVHLTQAMQYSLQHHLNQQQEIQLIKNQIQALVQNHR